MFLTGIKDVDFLILRQLSDVDLQNLSFCSKEGNNIVSHGEFWKRRFLERYGKAEKTDHRTWKNFYFMVKYLHRENDELTQKMFRVGFPYTRGFNGELMKRIAKGGYSNLDIIQFFLPKCSFHGVDFGMEGATEIGDEKLIDFFISRGATSWGRCLGIAAREGNKELVFFFSKKAPTKNEGVLDLEPGFWGQGLWGAVHGGHFDLILYFVSKGAPLLIGIGAAASIGNLRMVKFLCEYRDEKYDLFQATFTARKNGYTQVLEYLEKRALFQKRNGSR